MARVSPKEVKAIIDTDLSNPNIDVFILSANITVTAVFSGDTVITTAQLKEIERWLTAHLIASSKERQAQSEKAGDAAIKYSGETGEGLKSTSYGQQVLFLDTTGKMASATGKKRASITAITSFD